MTKFGFVLPDELLGVSLEETLEYAIRADQAGLHSVWKGESSGTDAIAVLAAVARSTDDIRIGSCVANVYSRSPTQLGMSAVTLEELSDGRALLGLGISSQPLVRDWHGMTFDRPLRRLRESIEIVRQTMAGGVVEYDGRVFDIGPYRMLHDSAADVPILNAAIGETNRRLTAEYADGWLPAFIPQSSFSETVSEVLDAARRADRDPEEFLVAPLVPIAVGEDTERTERLVRYFLAQEMAMGYNEQVADYGFGDAPDRAHELFRNGDRERATAAISDRMVEEFTVHGTAADVREQLRPYVDGGANVVIAMASTNATGDEIRRLVDFLGDIGEIS